MDVLPRLVPDNRTDRSLMNAEFASQRILGDAARRVSSPNVGDSGVGQLAHAARLSPRNAFRVRHGKMQMASFGPAVMHVVGWGSKEEMRRIHTVPHVATMTNHKVIGDGAEVNLPRKSMRAVVLTPVQRASVSVRRAVATPKPTVVRFLDQRPKPILNCGVIGKLIGHRSSLLRCGVRVVCAARRIQLSLELYQKPDVSAEFLPSGRVA